MNYAVVKIGGKQYTVTEGQTLNVENLKGKSDKLELETLLLVTDKGVKIGKPTVSGVKVVAKILNNIKGDKIRVAKFKSKVRYRRLQGFRQALSVIKIEKIDTL